MPVQHCLPLLGALAAAVSSLFIAAAPVHAQAQSRPEGRVKLDVPYVPTPESVVERMLDMAKVTENDFVIDLGSGDGRTPITAALKYKARGFGVDIDPTRIAEANDNARKAGVGDRVSFRREDLFVTPIREASVLTMYLLSTVNLKLRPRILQEMKPGSRVVSHAFDMGDWEADQNDTATGYALYLWIVPAKVDGRWQFKLDGQTIRVVLTQKYQKVGGTASVKGRQRPLESVKLTGAELSFVLDTGKGRRQFVGTVNGDVIEASKTVAALPPGSSPPRASGWRATRR